MQIPTANTFSLKFVRVIPRYRTFCYNQCFFFTVGIKGPRESNFFEDVHEHDFAFTGSFFRKFKGQVNAFTGTFFAIFTGTLRCSRVTVLKKVHGHFFPVHTITGTFFRKSAKNIEVYVLTDTFYCSRALF